ncbi:hypothetical protein CC78DRAFT_134893 [Lojkania enalia]|uniref:Uncharacterized protein n=1 Tax=Lojkania enalia TaxID=147567 RepID=A0A9P4NCJ8_9PLEO|nr:hypothetical protein CC78DRAFT_134893 [Didymosphaeria enalia]
MLAAHGLRFTPTPRIALALTTVPSTAHAGIMAKTKCHSCSALSFAPKRLYLRSTSRFGRATGYQCGASMRGQERQAPVERTSPASPDLRYLDMA